MHLNIWLLFSLMFGIGLIMIVLFGFDMYLVVCLIVVFSCFWFVCVC